MSRIMTALVALTLISAATAPSFAFDAKKFWLAQDCFRR